MNGWKNSTTLTEDGQKIAKPKERWTEADKETSKFNLKALTAIFAALDMDKFKLIQGCECTKEAWDTLLNYFEGDTSVRLTRIDHPASSFENLRMEKEKSIASFSAKLSTIANEVSALGKNYKEKNLVKKLRCLPPRSTAHKAILKVTINTYDMKFDKLVGMFKAEEIEVIEEQPKSHKGITFTTDQRSERLQKIEDNMSLMARNFNKMLKRVEKRPEQDFEPTSKE